MLATLITPPSGEPVTPADLEAQLRLDTQIEDALLQRMISAARGHVENVTKRVLMTQTWRILIETWPFPAGRDVSRDAGRPWPQAGWRWLHPLAFELPVVPLRAVTAVATLNLDGTTKPVDPMLYKVDRLRSPALFLPNAVLATRAFAPNGLQIDLDAGYGAASDVPAPLREAIIRLAAYWFEHRIDDGTAARGEEPPVVSALLAPYRVLR